MIKEFTGIDLTNYIINTFKSGLYKYQLLITIQKIKKEIRSEKLIILSILNFISFRSESDLENILCM